MTKKSARNLGSRVGMEEFANKTKKKECHWVQVGMAFIVTRKENSLSLTWNNCALLINDIKNLGRKLNIIELEKKSAFPMKAKFIDNIQCAKKQCC